MITVKKKQAEAFRKLLYEDFLARMVLHIRNIFEDEVHETDDELFDKVEFWIEDAVSYDIRLKYNLRSYIEIAYCEAEKFGKVKPKWIENILNSHTDEDKRMELLYYKLIEDPAEELPQEDQNKILQTNDDFDTIV